MEQQTGVTKTRGNEQVKFLTITALGTALVYVFTAFINIRLPIAAAGGLIHLGNVPLFIFAILFGKRQARLQAVSEWDFLICFPAGHSGHHSHL